MELQIQLESENSTENVIQIDNMKFQKMLFLFNALNEGWTIKKRKESYIFTKNHEGKREIFLDTYLMSFLKKNFDINKLLM